MVEFIYFQKTSSIYQLERNIIKKIHKILLNDGLIDESDIEIEKEYTRNFLHNLLKLS